MTLKNDVPVTDGLDDFVLQAPDGPKLIGFLKAMEFTSLTRRVAEATGTEAGDVEAVAVTVERGDDAHGPDVGAGAPAPADAVPSRGAGRRQRRPLQRTPPSKATPLPCSRRLRLERAATGKIDTAAYHCIRDLATLKAWIAEAREAGVVAFDTETTSLDPMQAELVGFALAIGARPRRLRAASPTRAARATCSAAARVENQIPMREALARAEAAAGGPVGPQDRAEPEIRSGRDAAATASTSRPSTTRC